MDLIMGGGKCWVIKKVRRHVPHECTAEEDGVDERLDGGLVSRKTEPDGSHLLDVSP